MFIVTLQANNIYLTDKGSKYGTFVNEIKLKHNEKHKLKDKDLIKFGLLDNTHSKAKYDLFFIY